MAIVNPTMPTAGSPRGGEEIDLANAVQALLNEFNGNIDSANLKDGSVAAGDLQSALLDLVGVSGGGVTRRGKSIIAAAGSRTNVAYGALDNGPDRVSGLVLPTDGVIRIRFVAVWQESVPGAARAAVFIGANQLKTVDVTAAAPVVQETQHACANANTDKHLTAHPTGLYGSGTANTTAYTGDVATGQILGVQNVGGGPIEVRAAAGTYDISVQFKASSGSVTVKNRTLLVEAIGF